MIYNYWSSILKYLNMKWLENGSEYMKTNLHHAQKEEEPSENAASRKA